MAQVRCGACHGTGKQGCSACHGKRVIARPGRDGMLDISPCLVCQGTGQMRCSFCGGGGSITTGDPPAPSQPPGRPQPESLEGNWRTQGGAWFVSATADPAIFDVVETGALGKTGSGSITLLPNRQIQATIRNVLLGATSYNLQWSGNTLSGNYKVMGMQMPIYLTKA